MPAHRNGGYMPCASCGIPVWRPRYKLERDRTTFCSPECRKKMTHVRARCMQCGKEADVQRWRAERRQGHYFCNRECFNLWRSKNLMGENSPGWKGGYHYEYGGTHWKRQRRLARERDLNTCQDCGVTEQAHGYRLDVHHRIPYHLFESRDDANILANLVTLCRQCHVKRHRDALTGPQLTFLVGD